MAGALSISNTFQTQTGPIPLSQLDTNFSQLVGVVNNTQSYSNYYVDSSGAANTITVTIPLPTTFAYAAGVALAVKLANTNTSASVNINVNTLGNMAVQNFDGSQPAVGQLVAGQILQLMYNGTAFVLTGANSKPASIAPFTATTAGNVTLPAPSSGNALAINAFSNLGLTLTGTQTGVSILESFQANGAGAACYIGQSGGASGVVAGDTLGDFGIRSAGLINFANENSATRIAYFDANGNFQLSNGTGSIVGPVYAGIPQTSISASYTTVLGDANKHILCGGGSAKTVTLAANSSVAYPVGTAITLINAGGGVVTLSCSDTVLFAPSGSTGSRTLAATASATLLKITSVEWVLTGVGVT